MSHRQGPSLPVSYAPAAPVAERVLTVARDLPGHLSARTLLSRGQAIVGVVVLAAIIGILGLSLTMGVGPSPRDVAVSAVAVATIAYVVVIAFRLALVAAAQDTCGQLSASW